MPEKKERSPLREGYVPPKSPKNPDGKKGYVPPSTPRKPRREPDTIPNKPGEGK